MYNGNLQKMIEAADLLGRTLNQVLMNGQGLHAETAIAAAARMSGTMLYRSFSPPYVQAEPGTPISCDAASRDAPLLMDTMFATLKRLGHLDLDDFSPAATRSSTAASRLSLAETQQSLECWYRSVGRLCDLSFREMAGAAAMSTASVIHDCRSVLDVHSGCAIAIHGLVEAVKTVPSRYLAAAGVGDELACDVLH